MPARSWPPGSVQAWMPSGRVVTYNGAHADTPDGVRIRCIVDDQTAAIATRVATRADRFLSDPPGTLG